MALSGYKMTNNAQGALNVGISASALSVILQTGQGDLFPTTFPFLAKIEQFSGANVVKREIVRVTNRSGDTLTIVRNVEACPLAYNSVTQQQVAQSFLSGDTFSQIVTSGQMKEIHDEIALLALKTEVQNSGYNHAIDTGTATGYIINPTPAIGVSGLVAGQEFSFVATNANNGAATLKVWAAAAIPIKRSTGSVIQTGDIIANQLVTVRYDGTAFQMTSGYGSSSSIETQSFTQSWSAGEAITAGSGLGAVFFGKGVAKTHTLKNLTANTNITIGNADANTRFAFYFTPSATEKLNRTFSITLFLKKVGNPTDNLEFRLLDSTKTAVGAWTTATIAGATVKTVFHKHQIFQQVAITGGSKYYLETRRSGANDGTNYYVAQVNNTNVNTGYGYATYTSSTTTWTADNEFDPYFIIDYGFDFTSGKVWNCDARYKLPPDGIATTSAALNTTVKVATNGIITDATVSSSQGLYINSNTGWFGIAGFGYFVGTGIPGVGIDIRSLNFISDISTGEDGYADFDGTKTYADFATKSGNTYTLTKSVQLTNLRVATGVTLISGGWKIYAFRVKVEGTGVIHNGGANGTIGGQALGGLGGFFPAGGLGGNAPTTNWVGNPGTVGGSTTRSKGGSGGASDAAGGTATQSTMPISSPSEADNLYDFLNPGQITGGGGGGASNGINAFGNYGAGGGGGGGICFIYCFEIWNENIIHADWGKGADGQNAGSGAVKAGGGGGGGVLIIIYRMGYLGRVTADGGSQGLVSTGSPGALSGNPGNVYLFNF